MRNREFNQPLLALDQFSSRLHACIAGVETVSHKKVYVVDNSRISAPVEAMPGTLPPPFFASPDYSQGIIVYATPQLHSLDETEAAIAQVLTMTSMQFEGFPNTRFTPGSFLVLIKTIRSGGGSTEAFREADPIQRWLYNAMLNLVASIRLAERGYRRNKSIEVFRHSVPFQLSENSRAIVKAIDLAFSWLEAEEGLLSEETGKQLSEIQGLIESSQPNVAAWTRQIVQIVRRRGLRKPDEFTCCLLEIMQLWHMDDFVEFGRLNIRTGRFETMRKPPNLGR